MYLKKLSEWTYQLPIPRMTWQEAMDRFGSDKPDTRFGMELVDVSETVARTVDSAYLREHWKMAALSVVSMPKVRVQCHERRLINWLSFAKGLRRKRTCLS